MSKKNKDYILWSLKICVTFVVLYFVFKKVDFLLIRDTFKKINPLIFMTALSTQFLVQLFQALRWKSLALEKSLSLKEFYAFTCLSNAMLLISPGAIISDSINAFLMGKRYQMQERAFISVILGRIFGIIVIGIFFLVFLPFNWSLIQNLVGHSNLNVPYTALAGLVLILAAFFGFKRILFLKKYWLHLKEVSSSPKLAMKALILSVLVQLSIFAIAYQGYITMHVSIGLENLMFFGPLINLVGLIPLTIGQVGVREGLNVFLFTLIPGVTKEEVLATVAFGYCISIAAAFLNLGLAWLLMGKAHVKPSAIETSKDVS